MTPWPNSSILLDGPKGPPDARTSVWAGNSPHNCHDRRVATQRIGVLSVLRLPGRALLLLELDAPVPVDGLVEGMSVELELAGGVHRRAQVKSLGFASSTPEHAHVVVTTEAEGEEPVQLLQFEPADAGQA
jgi:hypothetical protein